jgi:hypothetical protein
MPDPLQSLSVEDLGAIFGHPTQQAVLSSITGLLEHLDQAHTPAEYRDFQRQLLRATLDADAGYGHRKRQVKRLRDGQKVSADAPDVPPGRDPSALHTWAIEVHVFDRAQRQMEAVGDALAWRLLHYDRRAVLALCRNDKAGPMHNKTGLRAELDRCDRLWRDDGNFALLTDLTSVMRIGDLLEFRQDNTMWLHEVKTNPSRTSTAQNRRMKQAVDALNNGGLLPGKESTSRLASVDVPFVAHTRALSEVLSLASERRALGAKLPGPVGVMAASMTAFARDQSSLDDGMSVINAARRQAHRLAGTSSDDVRLEAHSGDTAARSTHLAPWGIFPLSARQRAELITDYLLFETHMARATVVSALENVGLSVTVMQPQHVPRASTGVELLRVGVATDHGQREMTVHDTVVGGLLLELMDLNAWANGVRQILERTELTGSPEVTFAYEHLAWS